MLLCLTVIGAYAQAPNGSGTYYQAADGKKGEALKTAMYNIIKLSTPAPVSYSGLWTAYEKTDKRSDGYLRDWYSNSTNYVIGGSKQGASYNKEGDSYNREHLVPQSWFGSGLPKSDVIQVVPVDGYVNNMRSNNVLAEVETATYSSNNGYCKLGTCKTPGGSGTVFEPNDEVKGDIARIYFYMATSYQNSITGWGGGIFTGTYYQPFAQWYLDMLMRWSKADPVDDVEIARNNAVYSDTNQKNRNPFVDYPGLEDYIWGDKVNETFSYDNYNSTSTFVAAPTFTPATGSTFTESLSVTMSCSTNGATIYYTTDGSTPSDNSTQYVGAITLTETTTIKAVAYDGEGNSSSVATATYTLSSGETPVGDVFEKVTNASQLVAGQNYILVYEGDLCALGEISTTATKFGIAKVIYGNTDGTVSLGNSSVMVLTLGRTTSGWSFQLDDGTYLSWSSGNSLQTSTSEYSWIIDLGVNGAILKAGSDETRVLQFNANNPRFACYTSAQQPVYLYVQSTPSDKQNVSMTFSEPSVEATLGETFTPPTLTTDPEDLTVEYSSSNMEVATVDAQTGAVTLQGPGIVTITASFAGNDDYNPFSASYILEVSEKEVVEADATFIFNTDEGLEALGIGKPEEAGWYTEVYGDYTSGDVTMNITGGSNYTTRVYDDPVVGTTYLQVYGGGKLTFSSETPIVKIVFTSDNGTIFRFDNVDGNEWTGESTSVTFTNTSDKTIHVGTVTVFLKDESATALMYESFSGYTGSSDSSTVLTTSSDVLDYDNWSSISKVYAGKDGYSDGGCGKFGSSSVAGSMTTGNIGLTGNGRLTFKLKKYGNDNGSLTLTITGANTEDEKTFSGLNTEWTSYTVHLTEATGDVTLTFTSEKRLYIDDIMLVDTNVPLEPEIMTVNVSSVGYATMYYSDKNLVVPEGMEAYTYKMGTDKLTISTVYEAGDVIPQGTGVVLKATEGSYSFEVTEDGGFEDEDNLLCGTDERTTISEPGYKYYMLSLNKDSDPESVGFYWGKNSNNGTQITNGAHKAYLAVPTDASTGASGVKSGYPFSEIEAAEETISDGIKQYDTQRSQDVNAVYNLQGQRVNSTTLHKGIYVVNGRKVLVK